MTAFAIQIFKDYWLFWRVLFFVYQPPKRNSRKGIHVALQEILMCLRTSQKDTTKRRQVRWLVTFEGFAPRRQECASGCGAHWQILLLGCWSTEPHEFQRQVFKAAASPWRFPAWQSWHRVVSPCEGCPWPAVQGCHGWRENTHDPPVVILSVGGESATLTRCWSGLKTCTVTQVSDAAAW